MNKFLAIWLSGIVFLFGVFMLGLMFILLSGALDFLGFSLFMQIVEWFGENGIALYFGAVCGIYVFFPLVVILVLGFLSIPFLIYGEIKGIK